MKSENHIWHALPQSDLVAALEVVPAEGLDAQEAAVRLTRFGANRLAEAQPRQVWLKFLDQFRNVLVIVLLFAATLALAICDFKDALVILVVIIS